MIPHGPAATEFLLASILLEPARWRPGRPPTIRASDWSEPAAAAGFDGWELFENHYRKADPREQRTLAASALPVKAFNTYESFAEPESHSRQEALTAALRLGAGRVKFNVGRDRSLWPAERTAIARSRQLLGPAARLLCECHPGTSLETPGALKEFTAGADDWPFDIIVHPFLLAPERILEWGHAAGAHLCHAHVQIRGPQGPNDFIALADDAPRARDCLAALAAAGFRGAFSFEFAAPTARADETPESLFAAARRDLDFLREHWRPPIP
jgi:sugar phosphate isomerase/epimerase